MEATANRPEGGQKSLEEIAREVIEGKWGTGEELRDNLAAAGLPYIEIMAAVAILKAK